MYWSVKRAAGLMNVSVEDLLAAIERGDLSRPLRWSELIEAWNDEWVVQGRAAMVERWRVSTARNPDVRREIKALLGIPWRAVTAAGKRGQMPTNPTVEEARRLVEEMPDWLVFARCAVDAGEPARAASLAGIDDPLLRSQLWVLAALAK